VVDQNNVNISTQAPSSLHWDAYCPDTTGKSAGGDLHSGSGDLSSGFHTYGLEWTPSVERYFYDGILVWTVNDTTQVDPPSQITCPWSPPQRPQSPAVPGPVSHDNEFIRLCSEVLNGGWCGTIPPGGFGANSTTKMKVDYFRHYQLIPAPTNLTATAASCIQINLAWTDNSFAEDNYKVERSLDNVNFSQIATLAANSQSYQDTNLSNGTQYYYRVRASVGGVDGSYSSTANATTASDPGGPPANIAGLQTSTGKTSIALTWTAPGDHGNVGAAAQYELRYSTSPINTQNFPSATLATTGTPRTAGSVECRLISGLACAPTT
jgi:hypothetical protein